MPLDEPGDRFEINFRLMKGSATIRYRVRAETDHWMETMIHVDTRTIPGLGMMVERQPENFTSVLGRRYSEDDRRNASGQRGEPLALAQIKERLARWTTVRTEREAQAVIDGNAPLPSMITLEGWKPSETVVHALGGRAQTFVR